MIQQLQGRFRRRYVALLAFVLFALLCWRSQGDFSRTGILRRPFITNGIHYRPSSYDWSKAKIYHPVEDFLHPPKGSLKRFPRIQAHGPGILDDGTVAKRKVIKEAFIKSWNAYKTKAWGQDELAPLTGTPRKSLAGWGAQLIDALDTLWIMDIKDEFYLAVREVATIDWAATTDRINLFETTIRYLGGLISAFELSDERVLLYKAIELGDILYAAFDTPNRLPTQWIDVYKVQMGQQEADERISGAASGTLCLEFTRLTQLTGDSKYYDATERLKRFFHRHQNETDLPGLWPHTMNFKSEKMDKAMYTLGAGSDSLYEYLPKMHALLGGLDPEYEKMLRDALEAVRDHLLFRPMNRKDENLLLPGKATFNKNKVVELAGEMEHLACFAGGMYALAGRLVDRGHYVDVGSRLTRGCIWAYDSFDTNIMPEVSDVVTCEKRNEPCPYDEGALPSGRAKNLPDGFARVRDTRYQLRPEAIESVFYLWRITGDRKYRDAAWRMWEGIAREAETELAFAAVDDVRYKNGPKDNSMEVSKAANFFACDS